jgi:hypothetical protein
LERLVGTHDSKLFTFGTDHSYLREINILINESVF